MNNQEAIRRIKDHMRIHCKLEYPRAIKITEALNTAISALEAQQADRWILAHIELPIDDICASTYVTIKHKESGNVFTSRMRWYFGKFVWYNGKTLSNNYEIIAWKYTNLPEPYKEEQL